jgi:hypothetical protein
MIGIKNEFDCHKEYKMESIKEFPNGNKLIYNPEFEDYTLINKDDFILEIFDEDQINNLSPHELENLMIKCENECMKTSYNSNLRPDNIIIGKPLTSIKSHDITEEENTAFDEERFLPKLLVKYGFFKSTGQVRKNRLDLWKELNKIDCEELKIGYKKVYIVVGE